MRSVIHVVDSLSRLAGGMFESVSGLAHQTQKSGDWRVCVFAGEDKFSQADLPRWRGIDTFICPARRIGSFESGFAMGRHLQLSEANVFHLHGVWGCASQAVHRAHAPTKTPYLVSPRGMLEPWALARGRWKKRLAWHAWSGSVLKQAACLHATCEDEAGSIRKLGLSNPVCVIPNGVDLPNFRATQSDNAQQKMMLFLGRLHPKKGLQELIAAWAQLEKPYQDEWKLVIGGWDDGGYESALKRMTDELGLQQRIKFIGPVFALDKSRLFQSAHAFILPSHSEGLPMAVLEAWSYGLAVVMTPGCHLPIGFERQAAIRVEPDWKSVRSGLHEMMKLPSRDLWEMGRRGRQLVEEKFTWPRVTRDMTAVYEWTLGGAKPESWY